jgi:macrolide-specific efflux system membrane fusion protein
MYKHFYESIIYFIKLCEAFYVIMEAKMKRRNLYIMIGAGALILTGCNLLPVEEELRTVPIVSPYKAEEYNYVQVERGDLQLTEAISCEYQPTQTDSLSFPIGGEYYGAIYVKAGDKVKKGDLLAELEMDEVTAAITESEGSIAKLELQLKLIKDIISIETKKLKLDENDPSVKQTIKSYEAQKIQTEDALYIAKERLKENLKQKEQRQIFASMDGIISDIKPVNKGDKSIEGREFIVITNDSMSFIARVKEPEPFFLGMKADIVSGGETIATSVTDIKKVGENNYSIIFAVEEPSLNFTQGSRGTYTLIREERKNVLYLSANAVVNSSNGSIVYGFDEKGFKIIKPVELGLLADGKYEILSGLTEGEKVILE